MFCNTKRTRLENTRMRSWSISPTPVDVLAVFGASDDIVATGWLTSELLPVLVSLLQQAGESL